MIAAREEDRRAASPQSVMRVIRLLETLCASPQPLGLADLARRLDTPKSSLASIVRGLAEEGFVTPHEGGWMLGPGAFGLGGALVEARRRLQSSDLIRDGMRRLAERAGETVLLAIPDDDGERLTYVDVVESRNAVRFSVAVGDRRALYATAGGRALLAARGDEDVRRYLDRDDRVAFTDRSEIDRAALIAAVARARDAGFAQTIDQAAEGVTGTAALIRAASGTALGALVIAAPSGRSHGRLEDLARLVREEADAISRSLGYRAPQS